MKADTQRETAPALHAAIGLVDVVMLGAGAAMGVSIFSVLAPAAKVGGSAILIAVFVAAVPMAAFALVYAFMASLLPKSGASFEWPRTFIHPFAGFLVAWLRIVGSVGVLVTLALVLVQYVSMALPLPLKPAMAAILLVIYLVNLRGIGLAARAQTIAMTLLILVLVVFVVSGAPLVKGDLVGNPLGRGTAPVFAAVPLMIPLFLGIETATEVGEEVRDATRTIPLALALALLLTALVYLAVAFTSLGLLGPSKLAASSAPLIEAGRVPLGRFALPLVLTAATLALLKSLNAIFVVFSRYLFAMARAGVLPAAMAKIHPRWGTPHIAATVAFAAAIAGLALPKDLVFLFVAISIPTVLKYLSTCVSALMIAALSPARLAEARFRLSRPVLILLAGLGVFCALGIFVLGFSTDWRPYVLIAGWGGVGVLWWLAVRPR